VYEGSPRIPFHRLNGRVFFDLADLDEYAERGRVDPAAKR
jgi:hypothetical protein